jgi:hypothetical protein
MVLERGLVPESRLFCSSFGLQNSSRSWTATHCASQAQHMFRGFKSSRKVRRHLASPALGKTKAEQSSTKFFSSAGERTWSRVTNHFAPSIRKMLSARDPASPTSPPRKLVVLYTGSGFQVLSQLLVAKGYKSIHFYSLRLVLERGLEPPWGCPHYDLNVARLPISPLQQLIKLFFIYST